MVTVSVIMPVFNEEKYIERACKSVINQSLNDMELICINDGSSDNSLKILEDMAENYNFITIISIEHKGVSYSRNIGIENAKGKYVSFLDADDEYLHRNALEEMYNLALMHDSSMVSANIKRVTEDNQIKIDENYLKNYYNYFPTNSTINSEDYGIPWAFYKNIYKTSFLNQNNIVFPNLEKGSDAIFLTNVLNSIDKIPVINKNLYSYHYLSKGFSEYNINSYSEKYDYVKHFKMILDICINKNHTLFESYKKVFVDYLLYGQNLYDDDLKSIIKKVFLSIDDFFSPDEDIYEYIQYFFKDQSIVDDKNKTYADLKYNLFRNVIENNNLNFKDLNSYLNLNEVNKKDNLIYSLKGLKKLELSIDNVLFTLKEDFNRISNENDLLTSNNNDILSSKSWKVTEFFRQIKHLIR